MFKKLKKKRLCLRFKKKSTSLRDINVVGNFVLQTAKIMSASAESLDSVISNSNSLVSILDQVFTPRTKSSTAPTSLVCSSKRNSLFNSQSNRSESINNSSPVTELPLTQNFFESISHQPSPEIEMITEENASFSEMMTSCYTYNVENSTPIFSESLVHRKILNDPLKKCFSSNDLDIKHIITLSKKSESVQTFISTNATLSIEIDICQTTGESNQEEDKKCNEFEQESVSTEILPVVTFHSKLFNRIFYNPLILISLFIGSTLIFVPRVQKIFKWFLSSSRPVLTLHTPIMNKMIPTKIPPVYYFPSLFRNSKYPGTVLYSSIYRV